MELVFDWYFSSAWTILFGRREEELDVVMAYRFYFGWRLEGICFGLERRGGT
ncbi:MAG: hypothetical protein ACTSRF_16490 [Candidatus Freyarchaeota archaeon]